MLPINVRKLILNVFRNSEPVNIYSESVLVTNPVLVEICFVADHLCYACAVTRCRFNDGLLSYPSIE